MRYKNDWAFYKHFKTPITLIAVHFYNIELYVRNKAKLLSINPNLTLSTLASYYNIGLENEEEKYWIKKQKKLLKKK